MLITTLPGLAKLLEDLNEMGESSVFMVGAACGAVKVGRRGKKTGKEVRQEHSTVP